MGERKIENSECIALLVMIMFNHIILNITKTIITYTGSSSLLNILFISVIALIIVSFTTFILKKFPTYDILDISHYIGGNFFKSIIGLIFICYFTFFTTILLNIFASCLQVIFFPLTNLAYICFAFIAIAIFCTTRKNNAIFKSTLLILPILIFSLIFLFIANIRFYTIDKIYPLLGNGINQTFLSGICNLFAFQGLAYIYFLPSQLKNPSELRKISTTAIIFSSVILLVSISIILFMFSGFVDSDEMMTLYSAAKHIKLGSFFQRLDSIFVLLWIIAFICYLCINLKFISNISQKIFNIKNDSIFIWIFSIIILICSLIPKNYAVSTFLSNIVYKYSFFIIVIGIGLAILLFAIIKQKVRRWFFEK